MTLEHFQEFQFTQKFYEDLEKMCRSTPRNDISIIVGDFKVKIGKGRHNKNITGKETINDNNNEKGDQLCNLAAATNTFLLQALSTHTQESIK